jgi:hypothetical protein
MSGRKSDREVQECNAGNVKLVVYLSFKKASEVCNFHFEISDLIFPHRKCINTYKNVH